MPMSPTRSSKRLAERASKKLCFNNPLTQTIITEKYIKSHIDLLAEEASPHSAIDPEAESIETLDLTLAYTGDETRDGGQTPGPFEEMRRRMAGLGAESDSETPGNKKRKRKEKKRRWVWTIGVNEEDIEDKEPSPATSSSRSESPENWNQVQTNRPQSQIEGLEKGPVIKIDIPSETFREGPVIMDPIPATNFLSIDTTPMTAVNLRANFLQTPITAIRQWPEAVKFNLIEVKIEELPEPPAVVASIDSSGDTEMTDWPNTSYSI